MGFIPTRAGKILPRPQARRVPAVHPHSRGENAGVGGAWPPSAGSSPLARGKLATGEGRTQQRVFIPTRAGKMPPSSSHGGGPACSSPLARGKCSTDAAIAVPLRFIPTRAGKILRPGLWRSSMGVHPHSRGENVAVDVDVSSRRGSSPLARGKFAAEFGVGERTGFIPTRAGKIRSSQPRSKPLTVHPHSRGENTSCAAQDPVV